MASYCIKGLDGCFLVMDLLEPVLGTNAFILHNILFVSMMVKCNAQ